MYIQLNDDFIIKRIKRKLMLISLQHRKTGFHIKASKFPNAMSNLSVNQIRFGFKIQLNNLKFYAIFN